MRFESSFLSFTTCGIIIITISVNVVWVEFSNIISISFKEVLTTSWFRIRLTWRSPILKGLWVNEASCNHEFNLTFLEIIKWYDAVSNQDTFKFNVWFSLFIWLQNYTSQIWNVFTSIWFSSNPKSSVLIFREFLIETLQSKEIIMRCLNIVILKFSVSVEWKSNSSWWFQEK